LETNFYRDSGAREPRMITGARESLKRGSLDGNWRGGEGKESKERTQAEPIQGQEH
jgi:hypothetical protein